MDPMVRSSKGSRPHANFNFDSAANENRQAQFGNARGAYDQNEDDNYNFDNQTVDNGQAR